MFTRHRLFRIFSTIVIITILFSSVPFVPVSAQGGDGLRREVNSQTGKVSFIGPGEGQTLSISSALGMLMRPPDPAMALARRFGPEFGLQNPERDLKEMKSSRSEDGRITARYQQNYEGIPVMGGELIVNTNRNGDLYSLNGEVSPSLSFSTQPTVSSERAKQTALEAMAKWYRKSPEEFLVSEPELWIYDESLLRPSTRPAELVWRMEITPKDPGMPVRELVLVNAHKEGISLNFNQIDTAWKLSEYKERSQSDDRSISARELHENETTTNLHTNQKSTLQALIWYVATTGNDSNSCSAPASPCKTINAAIDKAPAGGTLILVASGTYTGTGSHVVTINKGIILSGGWDSTFSTQDGASIIDGGGVRSGIFIGLLSEVAIDHFVIQNCHADADGGGIYVSSGSLTLKNSSILNNTADRGAGLFIVGYSVILHNTTISGNQAISSGGGLYGLYGWITLHSSTIAYNHSSNVGGGIVHQEGKSNLQNSILAKNSATTNGSDCFGSMISSGQNIIGTTAGCSVISFTGDQFNVDPGIDSALTGTLPLHALQAGSPAINTGDNNTCLLEDQRGLPRPEGTGCDIGSYEYAVSGLTIVGGAGQTVPAGLPFLLTLTVSIRDDSLRRVAGVQVTFTAPATGASGIFADTGTRTTTVMTDANGVATTSKFTSNSVPGDYAVTASASGVTPVQFSLHNYAVKTLYVATTGNDSNPCLSPGSPCKTINEAIEKSHEGDTIKVAMGTYTGSDWVVVNMTKSITLSGGWDASFTAQSGLSTIDGQNARTGVNLQLVASLIERFVIQNGFTEFHGGGILNSGILVLRNSIVRDNTCWCNNWWNGSSDGGGGIANYGTLTVNNSTIVDNHSPIEGAGLFNYDGILTVNNSTISGNGSGIASYGTAALNSSTVTENGGGILFDNEFLVGTFTFTIRNTIVAGNSVDCWGPITSVGYNLIGNNSGCTFTATTGDKVGTSVNPINPRLTILQDNGGLSLTHALLPDSPAIDSGNPATPGSGGNACPATDQRGAARPAGIRCDIGSYEGFIPWTFTPLVSTYTANNSSSLPGTLICNQANPNCPAGDSHAKAAHQYAIGTYNLYALQYGRDGIDNNGMTINSTVHYKSNYNNAFWNGNQMVYGDAYGFPLADDVVAHELTHGVTQYESNLFYYYQSGAINESLSDLWGEYYDQTNRQGDDSAGTAWLVGEDVSGLGAIRNMLEPWRFGDPEKMTSIYYHMGEEDNGGVHHNSGINNHAVVLMAAGGGFNDISITSLGWAKTAAIYYEANTKLLTSGADYSDLYYSLQQACDNLIGKRGITAANCNEVKNALDAVEMNGQPLPNYNSDAPSCPAGTPVTNLFSDNLESGIGNWTFNNGAVPRWQWDSPHGSYARSGLHALYGNDDPGTVTDATAKLVPLTIPNNAYLHFSQAYGFESGYNPGDSTLYHFDGGVLEYSINGGATWADAGSLIDFNGYDGKIYTGTGNPLSGRNAFVGSSHGYISTRLKLASLAGKTVIFRWRMGLDEATAAWGWWLDNIRLYTCPPPPGAFDKTFPSNGADNQLPSLTLRWGASAGAASYQYCYDTTNDNTCSNWTNNGTSTSKVLSSLSPSTTYYWNVRASNSGGTIYANGSPTSFWSFRTMNPPGAFNKTSPANASTSIGLSTTLFWNNSPSANSYQYCYDIINDNQCNRTWSTITGTSVEITNLGTSMTYYWQVRATNPMGTTDADNQSWGSFTTTSTLPAGTASIETLINNVQVGKYSLAHGQSLRESYLGFYNGPARIRSTNSTPLIASQRVLYKVNGTPVSFAEMMALPRGQLSTTYWMPWYNNVDLNSQIRFGNASTSIANVHVYIAGQEMPGSPFTIAPRASNYVSFTGVNNGPVKLVSDQNIVASQRVIYKVGGINTSFSETMGLPATQTDTTYWLPWYNNVDLDTQLRFANGSGSTATVHVYIGGVEVMGSPFTLLAGESTRQSFAGVNNGPVKIVSDQTVVVAERVIYKVNGVNTSYSEMMALPNSSLDTIYWLPWYNNADLDTQLRFANTTTSTATVHILIGGVEMTGSPFTLQPGESTRQSFARINNGPVQIVSDVPIVAAERLIYKMNGKNTSFTEMMALPDSQLDTIYWLPWYNNVDLDTQLRFGVP